MKCSAECSPRDFGVTHPKPETFLNSQWRIPQPVYLVYRLLVAVLFVVMIVVGGTVDYGWYNRPDNRVKWFIFLTSWAFVLLTLDTLLQAVLVGVSLVKVKRGDKLSSMTWYLKFMWVLYNVAADGSIIVTIFYWLLVYPSRSGSPHFITIFEHGLNGAYTVINLFISGIPLRIHHFWHPVVFGLTFTVFSAIYDVSGGTNALDQPYIYEALDWTKDAGNAAMWSAVAVAGTVVVWIVLYLLYWLRRIIANCCSGCSYKNDNNIV